MNTKQIVWDFFQRYCIELAYKKLGQKTLSFDELTSMIKTFGKVGTTARRKITSTVCFKTAGLRATISDSMTFWAKMLSTQSSSISEPLSQSTQKQSSTS